MFCAVAGETSWKGILHNFWHPFNQHLSEVMEVGVREVIDEIDAALGPHLFPVQVCLGHYITSELQDRLVTAFSILASFNNSKRA